MQLVWIFRCVCVLYVLPSVRTGISLRELTDRLTHERNRFNEPTIRNFSYTTIVDVNLVVKNILDFEVSTGSLTLLGIFSMSWKDDDLTWTSAENDAVFIRLPRDTVWIPPLYIQNTGKGIRPIAGAKAISVTYDGNAYYDTPFVFEVLCDPDISKYPFDEHVCEIVIEVINGDAMFEITSQSNMNLKSLRSHSLWNVTSADVMNRRGQIVYKMNLKRKSLFLLMNLVSPVLILAILNVFVFCLPQESGERTSFSMTILLSFIVFISFMFDELPNSSHRLCVFNVFLLIQVVESALITACVIFLSHVYHKEDSHIPKFLDRLLCKKHGNNVKPIKETERCNKHQSDDAQTIDTYNVTWAQLSRQLNNLCLLIFVIITLIEKSVILIIITI